MRLGWGFDKNVDCMNVENVSSDTYVNVDFVAENSKNLEVEPGKIVNTKVEVSSQNAEPERTSDRVKQDWRELCRVKEKMEYNLKMADEVIEKLESKGYEVYTGGEEREESVESMRSTSRGEEKVIKEKMRKL